MGRLARTEHTGVWYLEAECIVGRSVHAGLRLLAQYVSTQHAMLRWNGSHWELKDLGSRNGTWLDGVPVEPRRTYPLNVGARLAFGHPSEQWLLESAAPPAVMVLDVSTSAQLIAHDAVLGIPSDESVRATIYKTPAGHWCLDREEHPPLTLSNGMRFEVDGKPWQFCCPEVVSATATSETALPDNPTALHFRVSRDEEYVELIVELADRQMTLGARSHNHLLLTLARARIADAQAEQPDTSSGWLYKEDLISNLETPERVDNEIFRIRKHFGKFFPYAAANVIERRFRTRQVRIGFAQLKITTL